jgi:hypothetical protein
LNRLIDSLKIRAMRAKSKVMFQSGWTLLSNEKDAITGGGRSHCQEVEGAEVAEDLELLTDFVADVGVVGMEFGQSVGMSIYVGESEFEFA